MEAMQVEYICSFGTPLPKMFVFSAPSYGVTLVFKYFSP